MDSKQKLCQHKRINEQENFIGTCGIFIFSTIFMFYIILFFTKNILLMKGVDSVGKYDNLVPVDRLRLIKKENRKLISTVLVPSASHSYALAVEYIQKWFLSKFSKDYF